MLAQPTSSPPRWAGCTCLSGRVERRGSADRQHDSCVTWNRFWISIFEEKRLRRLHQAVAKRHVFRFPPGTAGHHLRTSAGFILTADKLSTCSIGRQSKV